MRREWVLSNEEYGCDGSGTIKYGLEGNGGIFINRLDEVGMRYDGT